MPTLDCPDCGEPLEVVDEINIALLDKQFNQAELTVGRDEGESKTTIRRICKPSGCQIIIFNGARAI